MAVAHKEVQEGLSDIVGRPAHFGNILAQVEPLAHPGEARRSVAERHWGRTG